MTKEYIGYDDTEKYIQDQTEKPNWIYTYTGRKISLSNPNPNDIHIDDIIIPLSRLPRSNGHVKFDYPVLQHLLLAWEIAQLHNESPRIQLLVLLHDAQESYVHDINTVLKGLIKDSYKKIENKFEEAIYQHFGIKFPTEDELKKIKIYDTLAFKCECRVLFRDDSWINQPDEVLPDVKVYPEEQWTLRHVFRDLLLKLLELNGMDYKVEGI